MNNKMKDSPSIFTKEQFLYWQNKMGLSDELAAALLGTDVKTVRGYASGKFKVGKNHTYQCRYLENQKKSNGSSYNLD